MRKLLLSGLNKYIQCSDKKSDTYKLGISKFDAVDNNSFIQVRHKDYHKFIIIDVDSRENLKKFEDINNILKENYISLPNFIVKTNKGWHIWWVLDKPIFRNNRKQLNVYKIIKDKLNNILGGDNNFSGFIARNPLKHETFINSLTDLHTFSSFLNENDYQEVSKLNNFTKRRRKIVKNNVDFTKVGVGNRNQTLYKYLRTYGLVNFKDLDEDSFFERARQVNSMFIEPLDYQEVLSVSKSVFNWVSQHYNENYDKSYIIERNRLLAKEKAQKTQSKILTNLKDGLASLSILKLVSGKYSWKFLAKILKVDRKTVKKYFNLIKKIILQLVKKVSTLSSDIIFSLKELINYLLQLEEKEFKYILRRLE